MDSLKCINQPDVPLGPIMAAYNIAPFKLSKFLVPNLSKFTTNDYTIKKKSYEFTKYLSDFKLLTDF